MKKILFVLTLLTATPLCALIGRCFVKNNGSLHIPDYKKIRFVECYCQCSETHNPHTKCMLCDHYHEPQSKLIVIKTDNNALIKPNPTINYPTLEQIYTSIGSKKELGIINASEME